MATEDMPALEATLDAASPKDYGDAPFPYPTSHEDHGASHALGFGLWLGSQVDAESDGTGSWGADVDDFFGKGDEDGIHFTSNYLPGQKGTLTAEASRNGQLHGWIDFNADGDWNDAGEQILRDEPVRAGTNTVSFRVPPNIPLGVTYARFRLSDQVGIGPTGHTVSGEVEDYVLLIGEDASEIAAPIARVDQVNVWENSQENRLDVLENDQLPWIGGRVTHLDTANLRGSVTIGPGGGSLIYTPPTRFVGTDTFQYTVHTLTGEADTATVTIEVLDEVKPPTAADDSFVFASSGGKQVLYVLGNDLSENGTLRIIDISRPTAGGAIAIHPDGKTLVYLPPVGFVGQDEFYYTVQDVSGLTAEAHVRIDLRGHGKELRIRLATTDAAGQPITHVKPYEELWLNVFVQDVRPHGKGVFAAYVDIQYDNSRVIPDRELVHGPAYPHATSGSLSSLGQIDEAGGTDGVRPLGTGEHLLLQVPMRAVQEGWASFSAHEADESPIHDLFFFNDTEPVDSEVVEFGSTQICVVEFTNPERATDVDGNQAVTPLDALLVINELNASGPRELSANLAWNAIPQDAVDVNADGFLSPLDALQIINELNQPPVRPAPASSPGEAPATPWPTADDLPGNPPVEEMDQAAKGSDSGEAPDVAQPKPREVDLVQAGIVDSLFASSHRGWEPASQGIAPADSERL